MLLINKDFSVEFINKIELSTKQIFGFVYHDSISSCALGSPVDKYIQALRRALARGVDVRIICQTTDQIEKFRRCGVPAKIVYGYKTMHAKGFSFDSNYLIIGSHNFTNNAAQLNLEMSLSISDDIDILAFDCYFNTLWQK